MKAQWTDYPLALFTAAIRSTVGGIVTLILALSVATWIGIFALSGDIPSPVDDTGLIIFMLFAFVGPICIACLQFWGFLYLWLIVWFVHRLVYQDAPRLRTAALLLFPQFACTVIAFGIWVEFDGDILLRVGIATSLVALITGTPLMFDLARRRSQ